MTALLAGFDNVATISVVPPFSAIEIFEADSVTTGVESTLIFPVDGKLFIVRLALFPAISLIVLPFKLMAARLIPDAVAISPFPTVYRKVSSEVPLPLSYCAAAVLPSRVIPILGVPPDTATISLRVTAKVRV